MPTRSAATSSPVVELLTSRLLPFEDRALPAARHESGGAPDAWRFVDAPPSVVGEVLTALPVPPRLGAPTTSRPHGG